MGICYFIFSRFSSKSDRLLAPRMAEGRSGHRMKRSPWPDRCNLLESLNSNSLLDGLIGLRDRLDSVGFLPRMLLCCVMMAGAGYGAFANRVRTREPGVSLYSFFLESDNFNDWGKLCRIVCLVSFLAAAGVSVMKMISMLLGGPIVDLSQFK